MKDQDPFELYYDYDHEQMRGGRRERKRRARSRVNMVDDAAVEESAEVIGLEAGFNPTYKPSKHEAVWLVQSLREFYQQELISDVEALIKGGKEANVYRCAAHPATGEKWLAAKVYRPRMFRNLRNDHRYRLGRTMMAPEGRPLRGNDQRVQRAMRDKSAFEMEVSHTSWLMHEYATLELLHEAGADVPRPLAASENAILMGYIGDDLGAAPALNEIRLEQSEARRLLAAALANITLMLAFGRVHGDLSAYNILYWEGAITLIDFPQVVYSAVGRGTAHPVFSAINPDAYEILARDVRRVCDYFGRQGAPADAERIVDELWQEYAASTTAQLRADLSRGIEE